MQRLHFENRSAWRAWLAARHGESASIWIEFYKDGTPGVSYRETLEEALCWGWIDSLIKRVDGRVYVRKFSRRSPNSAWSELNKKLVAGLEAAGRMTPAGLAAIAAAKCNGKWDAAQKPSDQEANALASELARIIAPDAELSALYAGKGEKARQLLARYYFTARGEETRARRLERMRAFLRGEIAML
jgi:uncharacterized protein YdeI (YjbR/CyaY-like superfamily)